jgi:PiT family inorganic phosphate transporter
MSAVRWALARRIIWAWVLTIPASAAIAALSYKILAALGAQ